MSIFDSLGWIASFALTLLLIGIVIGARLFRPPTINVAPHAEAHSASTGAGGGGSNGGRGGLPLGMLIIGVVAVTALVAVSNAGSAVSDTAQRSIDAQAETFKALPTPVIIQQPDPVVIQQPDPVVVQQPVASAPAASPTITDVLSTITAIAGALGVVFVVIAVLVTRRPRQEPPPLTRSGNVPTWDDAFEIARENVNRKH